ncbi:MAG TPA: ATP-binding protein [Pyrinomonadaceae bacterium]
MATQNAKKLMSALPAREFFGRRAELDRVLRHADGVGGLRILSPPQGGASELLRQAFDRLFFDGGEIIPFYFALRADDGDAQLATRRFLQEFLLQTIAFRRRNPSIYSSAPEVCELSKLAPTQDAAWFERVIEKCDVESPARDDRSSMRNCLSAPLRAAAAGVRVFVMIDDLHNAINIKDGQKFLAEIADAYARVDLPFVFSARRRFPLPGRRLATLELDDLDSRRAGEFVVAWADALNVVINDQTRDLIAVQTGGRVGFVRSLISAAQMTHRPLDSFQHFEQVYTDEILKGPLGGFYRDTISAAISEPTSRRELIQLLYDGIAIPGAKTQLDLWQGRLGLEVDQFRRSVETCDIAEMISLDGSLLRVASENLVLADTIRSRYRIECNVEPRAVVAGEILAGALKRAPRMMANLYRREASVGLASVLSAFDFQEVPRAVLDYGAFRANYKGISADEVREKLAAETDRVILPQIVHTAPAEEYYPAVARDIERTRAVVALGFKDQNYAEEGEVIWLAAEIESKLEADRETAEAWCERLRAAAEANNFKDYRIWLVSPEGFSDGALDTLAEYNAIGSSRRQVALLRDLVGAAEPFAVEEEGVEYEMVIPVGEDTELIAAHALEEIARRHNFPPKSINQLKTALVEACINAAEHGLAPDRKIHQRFVVSGDKITISISNRGMRLADKLAHEPESDARAQPIESPDTRRGWGLNLIRGLMDDVRVEPVDDGTRITMTKFLREDARV